VIPSRSPRGSVGASEALGLIGVYRAVNIRATAIRQLSADVERGGQQIDRPLIIRRPSQDCSFGAFLQMTSVSLNTAGNAFWRIYRDTAGTVSELEVLNPHDVTIQTNSAGRVIGYAYRGRDIKKNEIQHLAGMRVPGSPYGLGPIQAAAAELRGALDLRDYASEWLSNGDTPTGVLSSDQHLTPEAAAQHKTAWHDSQGGRRSVAVLGAGLKYQPVLLSPEDAQFIQNQNFTVSQISRLFGIPANLMAAPVEGQGLTYQNVRDSWVEFLRFGLADEITEIEDAFTAVLPRGQRARLNAESLLRLDTESRYTVHSQAIQMGLYGAEYAREIEGIPNTAAPKTPPAAAPEEAA